jgi:predicted ribosome-associated RNA-binding protein Tma20
MDDTGDQIMWIQLTDSSGQTISLNSKQLVMIKEHGDKTLLVHTRGEVMVLQSQEAILKVLRRHQTESTAPRRERQIELH